MSELKQEIVDELNKNIQLLAKQVRKSNSLTYNVLLSFARGAASAIGATVIAAIVIAMLSRTIHSLTDIPIVGPIIENSQVEQFLQN